MAQKIARNEWIPIDGMWAARSLEGRGHYGRKYRVVVPRADFGEHLYLGGQARFTAIGGGDARIFNLPVAVTQVDLALSFDFEIADGALGGSMIAVEGLEVRCCVA